MTSDLDIAQREEELEQIRLDRMAYEIGVLVAQGEPRDSAIETVRNRYRELDDAPESELIRDDDGFVTHIDDIDMIAPPSQKIQAQAVAIAKEIRPKLE